MYIRRCVSLSLATTHESVCVYIKIDFDDTFFLLSDLVCAFYSFLWRFFSSKHIYYVDGPSAVYVWVPA